MKLEALQNAMRQQKQADCPLEHYFSDGLYARELFIPANVALVGARHKTNHLFIMVYGECQIVVDDGAPVVLSGYNVCETKAGSKKAINATKDTLMISFHVTDKKDVHEIGEDILIKDSVFMPHWKIKALGGDICG